MFHFDTDIEIKPENMANFPTSSNDWCVDMNTHVK